MLQPLINGNFAFGSPAHLNLPHFSGRVNHCHIGYAAAPGIDLL